ncbi:formate dehydrogenase gamma subunit [Ferrimonas sediminum]|uniref:Formate dehydrogenase gamma subunit n=2 Tax=Ferrimonas sediminum TaxID=718193 RepID=A0A1G8JI63_9GAMM|nr:formate dehydrogenase subunit gamma [Ferrimonas sediminum]SDI30771.1 formate dehydrogenase gamma subunit [Ferrimonas sediminum]
MRSCNMSRWWRLPLLALLFSVGAVQATTPDADEQAGKALMAAQAAELQAAPAAQATNEPDPLWTSVRAGESGRTSAQGPFAGQLINAYDPALVSTRSDTTAPVLALALFGMIVVLALFVLVNGPAKLSAGFSNTLVKRWPKTDVLIHWLMAIPCLLLIITGLMLLAGRFVFGDWLGPDAVGAMAAMAKPIHDYMAIPFAIAAVLAMIRWMKHNVPAGYDLKWFASVGGYINFGPFKGKHPDAGFSNAGEKLWFWSFTLFGLIVIGSGVIMLFPNLMEPTRTTSLIAITLHGLSAIILTGFTVVHIFMATVLSEGGMECMVSGYCDENWAKQHHNVWYDEIKADGSIEYRT